MTITVSSVKLRRHFDTKLRSEVVDELGMVIAI